MSDTILAGDFTIFYSAENNQKRIAWTGSATGTRTCNELYSALQDLFDNAAQMEDLVPIKADTPDIYRVQNQWFIDDDTVEHLTGGSIFSDKWIDGTTEHVLIIGYTQTTEFSTADIGRTIVGGTTTDTGTILDFNTGRTVLWIRPDDPLTAGDEFDNGTEAYSIQDDPADEVWAVDVNPGTFVDETVDFNDADVNDVDPFFAATPEVGVDYIAYGYSQQFSKLKIDTGTAGTGSPVVAWEYWNGAWTALAGVSDGTSAYTVTASQDVTFTIPSDWARTSINAGAQLFYVRSRLTTGYSAEPLVDQGFIGGVGAGSFVSDTRHGAGSAEGESAWVGITTIGTIEANSHVYIFQEDKGVAADTWAEEKIIATKGVSDWWVDGQIDILLKTKEAGSVFGPNPDAVTTGIATFLVRQYSKTFSQFIATSLSTTGGNTVVPFSTGDDLNNTTGYRQMVLTDSAGNWAVDDRIRDDSDTTIEGVISSVSGSNPTITLQYYLYGDPLNDFTGATGAFSNLDDTGTATAVAPTNVGPATDTGITITFGNTTEDINNGNGARPYSIRVNPNSVAILRSYERSKFVARRGSVEALQGQDGEEYVGSELQVEYSGQTANFTEGNEVSGSPSTARGVIVADHDDGATGDIILKAVRGTFTTSDTLSEGAGDGNIDTLRTIAPIAGAPFGTFAGGTFFGAPGVALTIANLIGADTQAYQLIDDDGTVQIPPNAVAMEVTNLVSGDTVAVFRRTGSAINKTQFTLAAGNNQGDTTVVVDATIGTDNPTNANSKVRIISSSGDEHRYRYDSYTSATFTLSPASTGASDGGNSSSTRLHDTTGTFVTDEVEVGDYVRDTTEGVFVRVTNVVSNAEIDTEAVTNWSGDSYSLNTLVENYGLDSAYVPFVERIADATSEANQLVQSVSVDVRVDVRNAGVILPFTQDASIGATGLSVAAIRNTDDIFT